jgi:uncharacterized phage protein (TIGR01671 family)
MRELKFRAWDPEEKKMYDIQSIDFARQQFWVKHDLCSYSFGVVPILQYTGLKDCQGKEIYEGDIIRLEESNTGVITYDEAQFIIEETDYTWGLNNFAQDSIEIIGNLYETPELAPKSEGQTCTN